MTSLPMSAASLPPLPDFMQPLAAVLNARASAHEYYLPLLEDENEVLACGAWCALIDRKELPPEMVPRLPSASRFAGVKLRAARLLEIAGEHELALQCLDTPADSRSDAEAAAIKAEIALDTAGQIEALTRCYLASGELNTLLNATRAAEAKGWRSGVASASRVVAVAPHNHYAAYMLLNMLDQANQAELLTAAIAYFRAANIHIHTCLVFEAAVLRLEKNYKGCLDLLRKVEIARADASKETAAAMHPLFLRLAAECRDKVGDYKGSYSTYVMLNTINTGENLDLDSFYVTAKRLASLPPLNLPSDTHGNHFVMLGFPRSGTTLLENILGAHPAIETFEEIPSETALIAYFERHLKDGAVTGDVDAIVTEARRRYYHEIERRIRKPDARAYVDKLPIRTAHATFLLNAFPDKRYIFSIRHPFDVVLSCFRQKFTQNHAMIHFNTFERSVAVYDFCMTEWFNKFTLSDKHVNYVRYDELVTDFERVARDTIAFLGVEWDDAVLGFATAAESRASKTPSYQKVRQGLSIGVQTYWRNYGFLFQSPEAKPLHKWAEFFGYPTK